MLLSSEKLLIKIEPCLGGCDLIEGRFPQHLLPPAQQGSLLIQDAARQGREARGEIEKFDAQKEDDKTRIGEKISFHKTILA